MLKMTFEEKQIYEWALKRKTNEGTFSQRGCRILADYIARNMVIDDKSVRNKRTLEMNK